eukprot:TRINITY_DN23920_c0_g1_i1.p1 TRINITY_DN23920_c0_g1~~TRINITY_DN23920_c0_g1_i1.p1  ORF type:complete len:295 (+),score=26.52 TRINITY_DN23920_c0_g1_i1:20-904(+)
MTPFMATWIVFASALSVFVQAVQRNEKAVSFSTGINFQEKVVDYDPANISTWTPEHVVQALEDSGLHRHKETFRFHRITGPVLRVTVEQDEKLLELGITNENERWRIRHLVLSHELPLDIRHWTDTDVEHALKLCGAQGIITPAPNGKILWKRILNKHLAAPPILLARLERLASEFTPAGTASSTLVSEAAQLIVLLCALCFSFIGCMATTSSMILTRQENSPVTCFGGPGEALLRIPAISWYAGVASAVTFTVCSVYFRCTPTVVLGAQMLLGTITPLLLVPLPRSGSQKQLV